MSQAPSLRQLRYFTVVAEELHFGRAARRLAISQPPLSQQIMDLEARLGVQLFERTRRSVALTPVARQWLPAVREVLAAAEALPDQARRLARGETGTLSLGFVSTADYGVLPELLRRFRDTCPDVEVHLREATSDIQMEALLREELDAGIVIPQPEAPLIAPLQLHSLQREALMAAVPEAWIREGRVQPRRGRLALAGSPWPSTWMSPWCCSRAMRPRGCTTPSWGSTPVWERARCPVSKPFRCRPLSAWFRRAWVWHWCPNPCAT